MKSIVLILILSIIFIRGVTVQSSTKLTGKKEYFPPPDSLGGWRTLTDVKEIKKIAGMDKEKLVK